MQANAMSMTEIQLASAKQQMDNELNLAHKEKDYLKQVYDTSISNLMESEDATRIAYKSIDSLQHQLKAHREENKYLLN